MHTVLHILILTTALFLASAVLLAVARPGGGLVRIGRRRPPPAGPHAYLYADMPGFSRAQLEAIARMPVPPHHDAPATQDNRQDNHQVTGGPRPRSAVSGGHPLRSDASGGAVSSRPMPPLAPPTNNRRPRRAF